MNKILITYFALTFAGLSTAQTQQLFMICTPHLKELNKVAPISAIFQKGDNYCAYISDNSVQIIEEGFVWLLNQISEAFISEEEVQVPDPLETDNKAFVEYAKEGSSPKDNTGYPDLPSWCKEKPDNTECLDGKRHFRKISEQKDWLDGFIQFWDVDGNWNVDMEVGQ